MKNVDKAHPEFEVEIGGETVSVVCNYRTIFNFEKATGRPLASFFSNPQAISSIENIVEFFFAAIRGQNKKFTKEWILDNLTPQICKLFTTDVFAAALKSAWVDPEEAAQEKKDETAAQSPSQKTTEKDESEVG